MNWRLKIAAKIILSRLPISQRAWQSLHIFRAGKMDDPAYAWGVFNAHFSASRLETLRNKTVLELGPGNGLLCAQFAHECGAAHTWLIDSTPIAAMPNVLHGTYWTEGIASLRKLPPESIDFLFSHAVLEHVRLSEFEDLIRETRRIIKRDGVASHQIDFRDHLSNALNSLRFSKQVWEGQLFSNSGFYTNRLLWPQMRRIFERCGFAITLQSQTNWPRLPTPRHVMAEPFRSYPLEFFECASCHAVLRPSLLE